jgi:co-chaperonin GroES (HSP10)
MDIMGGGQGLITKVKGNVKPIRNRVIVSDMNFGEQQTSGGIIITSDDGKDRGIKPRWARVVVKGDQNNDPYNTGDWILVEHGRWTRGFEIEDDNGNVTLMRTVEAESILGWQIETPQEVMFGSATDAGSVETPKPEDFGAR